MKTIGLALPTNRVIKPKCGESLLRMVNHAKKKYKIIPLVSKRGFTTAENRNLLSAQMVKKGCDYIFYADDDMIYEPDTINRLAEHDKDIIGGVYVTKYEVQDYVQEFFDGCPDRLAECKALGGGLMMVKPDVFRKLPQPWFWYVLAKGSGMIEESNDWWFCRRAREHGFKIWVDPTIKAEHLGLKKY